MINNELFELNKTGFCRDGEDVNGKFKTCIREILPVLSLSAKLSLDSVYVFERTWYEPARVDSSTMIIYISARQNLLAKKEMINSAGTLSWKEELQFIKEK